jgi:2-polyprenyl-6-hydroxyphenyl methylase/3-demethylubiquinone-9 3-methyltransferase
MTLSTTVDPAEIAKFGMMADRWWDPDGPFRPLHRLNPVRIGYIRDQATAHFGGDAASVIPLAGLTALDVGCGGGLVAEPLARLGAAVTAIDADPKAIGAARAHAADRGLEIDYRQASAEELAAGGAQFDLVLALEIVEHVADRSAFIDSITALVAPGGLLILSTLNRTMASLALGVAVAERVLGWVEPGTHDWRKFVRPSELARDLRKAGFELAALTGLAFDPLAGAFRLKPGDVRVNYFAVARRV